MNALVTLPIVLPLAAAALTLLLGRSTALLRILSGTVHVAVLGCAVALLILADTAGPQVVALGGWAAPLGIALVADRLSALLLVVAVAVLLAVLVYAISQSASDPDGGFPATVFQPTYLILTAGVCLAFLSGDLFTMFVGFEMLLTASYVLVTIGGTAERVRAGSTYILVSLTGSIMFLLSVGVIYAATGTVNLADLSGRLADLDPGLRQALGLMLLVVFSIKAAAVPMHAWLPDSYPSAPSPVTAVFAGLLTKVGVYALIRTQTLLFGEGTAAGPLLVLASLTMIVGMLGALAQSDLNRMLSFTLVGHIGFMLFGLGVFTVAGVAGAIFYTVHHILAQAALFLVSGIVERRTGAVVLEELGGLARISPVIAVLFALPAMSLAGIPPFSGFLAKVSLLVSAPGQGPAAIVGAAVVVLASLLTVRAMALVWSRAFWGDPVPSRPDQPDAVLVGTRRRVPVAMLGATAALIAAGLAIVVAAGPLQALTERAATDVVSRQVYVEAVLG